LSGERERSEPAGSQPAGGQREEIYRRAQIGGRLGFGQRPALLVVDLQLGFTAPEKSALAGELGEVIAATNRLIDAARPCGVPVLFTAVGYDPAVEADAGLWPAKMPALRQLTLGSDLVQIDARLRRRPGDRVLIKKQASAFMGTPLASHLHALGVDTLIVTGCTTSGCVRASVVDALGHGFRPIVAVEAVGDRAREPHEANLFDMATKYADVLSLSEVLGYLAGLPAR
jgi:nicotinamidase-related amidase